MSGSRKFNGKKLRDARIYRGKSILELAEAIGVTKQAISQFENCINTPNLNNLLELSKILNIPTSYFFEPDIESIEVGNTYFRALVSSTKKDRQAQINKAQKVVLLYKIINEYLEMPEFNIIDYDYNDSIEETALKLRQKWNLGLNPINNIVNLMEKNGIIVSAFNTNASNIDAFSQLNSYDGQDFFCVVLGNDNYSATRRQFNAAHELGHILMHDWDNNDIEEISKEEFRKKEDEANQFAAEFLLPKETFLNDLLYAKDLDFYVELKKKWKVSISAMIKRAYQLEKLNVNQYQYLMKQISKRGWRKNEPLDDIIKLEQPTLFKKSIKLLLDENVLDVESILDEFSNNGLGLGENEIEELLCLEKDTLKIVNKSTDIIDFINIKK